MEIVERILARCNRISKPQWKFLLTLFTTILVARGKINFRNLSRYSDLSEETYSRQFAKPFDFVGFNRQVINEAIGTESERIIAYDPSFVAKSGKKTYGLDYFWNGCHNRPEKGLEISTVAIVDIEINTGFALSVRQTIPPQGAQSSPTISQQEEPKTLKEKKTSKRKGAKKSKKAKAKKKSRKYEKDDETLIDQYLTAVERCQAFLAGV